MSQYNNHHLKRLQHSTHTSNRSSLPNDEVIRESIQNFSISSNNNSRQSRPFRPGPRQARRGGGGGRSFDRNNYSFTSLPKRIINYDLAENFMDHSTNPLSSDLYKIRFKHSAKQWPNGRFIIYKDKIEKSDGNTIDITCTRAFPIIPKRKKMLETKQNEQNTIITTPTPPPPTTSSSIVLADPTVQEQKKKLADKQTNFYANLFGCGKFTRIGSTNQIKKSDCINNSIKSSNSISLISENKEDHQC